MSKYVPPFSITNRMLDFVPSIMEKIGKLDGCNNLEKMPILRRNNRINSIHSSLSIENNLLSFEQMKDVIDGKLVLGSANEIMSRLNIKSKENFRTNYLDPTIKLGMIKPTIPLKPTSKNQRYYKVK